MLTSSYRYAKKIASKVYNYSIVPYGWTKSQLIRLMPGKHDEDYPIDFVVTWVDGDDPEWQKSKAQYEGEMNKEADNSAARYRDWGLMRYWFRAVEQYAPWVRKVFFITNGQKPDWLDLNNKKLVFLEHKDFIPEEYLPTFNSRTIELNLWRIEELSEHFVYFNDDLFLNQPIGPDCFFQYGLPRLCALAVPLHFYTMTPDKIWLRTLVNDIGIINDTFDIRKAVRKNPDKFYSHIYRFAIKYNLRICEDNYIAGVYYSHSAMPFLKSIFAEIWDLHKEILDQSCRFRFRDDNQVTIFLPTLWMIFRGKFVPVEAGYYGRTLNLSAESVGKIKGFLHSDSRIVCLNDSEETDAEDEKTLCMIRDELHRVMQMKFPEVSSFELH